MNIFKKFNLLDYVIAAAFLLIVLMTVYNFIPKGKNERCKISFVLNSDAQIEIGDLCTDAENSTDLGLVSGKNEKGFYIITNGKKAEHGTEINGINYLKNMPLKLYIGDFYAEAEITEISRDN